MSYFVDLTCLKPNSSPLFYMALIAGNFVSRVSLALTYLRIHHSFVDPNISFVLFTRHVINP